MTPLHFRVIDWMHGLRCRGRVIWAKEGPLCLLCDKEWGE